MVQNQERSNMDTTQIYSLVNEIVAETMGSTDIDVCDTNSLVALGNTILSSSSNTEAFLNTLVQRIGKTIISYRPYTSQLSLLDVGDMEWGQIMQKIKVDMPTAEADPTYDLVDGESIDMYKVHKPAARQKLFVKRTPVDYSITTQRKALKEAFTGAEAMGNFQTAVYGEVRNAIELGQEDLGRLTMANYMANAGAHQRIKLVSEYNEKFTADVPDGLDALVDNDFDRWAIARIKNVSMKMQTMSVLYNNEECQRHTPFEMQRFVYLVDFMTALETQVNYAAFNDQYVKLATGIAVPYWQSAQDPDKIMVTNEADENFLCSNVVAFIHDRDALGTYRREEEALTTPVNSKGRYYNTDWHVDNLYFNDMSENGIYFTLD